MSQLGLGGVIANSGAMSFISTGPLGTSESKKRCSQG